MTSGKSADQFYQIATFRQKISSIQGNYSAQRKEIELGKVLQDLLVQLGANPMTSLEKEASALLAYMQSKDGVEFSLADSPDSIETLQLLKRYLVCGSADFTQGELSDLEYRVLYLRLAYCRPEDRRQMLQGMYEEFADLARWNQDERKNRISFKLRAFDVMCETAKEDRAREDGRDDEKTSEETVWRQESIILGQQVVLLRSLDLLVR